LTRTMSVAIRSQAAGTRDYITTSGVIVEPFSIIARFDNTVKRPICVDTVTNYAAVMSIGMTFINICNQSINQSIVFTSAEVRCGVFNNERHIINSTVYIVKKRLK